MTSRAQRECPTHDCCVACLVSRVRRSGDAQAVNSRRSWIIDQFTAFVRNGAIPKSDDWIQLILDWLCVHGLFIVAKKSEKSPFRAVRGYRYMRDFST